MDAMSGFVYVCGVKSKFSLFLQEEVRLVDVVAKDIKSFYDKTTAIVSVKPNIRGVLPEKLSLEVPRSTVVTRMDEWSWFVELPMPTTIKKKRLGEPSGCSIAVQYGVYLKLGSVNVSV